MTQSHDHRRLPWVALSLSLLAMGVGHIYCGRVARGLVLYVAWFAVPVFGLVAALLPVADFTLLAFLLAPTLIVLAYVFAAIDAYRIARQSDHAYQPQDFNRTGLYALLIFVQLGCPMALTAAIRESVFEAFYIPTRSMNPTILAGDRLLVNKLETRRRFPERGDLVVFRNPGSVGGNVFVSRIAALAGDTIVVDGERVEINGRPLLRDPIPQDALRSIKNQVAGESYDEVNAGRRYKVTYGDFVGEASQPERFELTVPPRSVFVLGDNRDRSRDSRHFGAVHIGDIIGLVQYIYYPAETWSRFGAFPN